MDLLTIAVMTTAAVAVVARVVEIAIRRPEAFAVMLEGARSFAEGAVAESAALRASRLQAVAAASQAPAEREDRLPLAA